MHVTTIVGSVCSCRLPFIAGGSLIAMASFGDQPDVIAKEVYYMHQLIVGGGALDRRWGGFTGDAGITNDQGLTPAVE